LVNETNEAGTHAVIFNLDNLPSGMYFYKLHIGASTGLSADEAGSATENFVDVKKMLLLK
jgi:hypothetical protein